MMPTVLLILALVWALGFGAGYFARDLLSRRRRAAARKKFHAKNEHSKIDDRTAGATRSTFSALRTDPTDHQGT
jgi:hypothetical protein